MTTARCVAVRGATFIVPLRADSIERLRNVAYVVCYLTTTLDATVILQEVGPRPFFGTQASSVLRSLLPPDARFQYLFEPETRRDGVFHRTNALNDMILRSTTPVVVNYDADVILPTESYLAAVSLLLAGHADIVYPYEIGPDVQRRVFAADATMHEFAARGYTLEVLDAVSRRDRTAFGHCQFFRREVYIAGYLENENFMSYGPEDVERFFRFSRLGYRIRRLEAPIYHLEHPRTPNSSPANPFMASNVALWERLRALSPGELYGYYERQPYLWARKRHGSNGTVLDLSRTLRAR